MMVGRSCRITGDAPSFPAVVRELSVNGRLMTMPCQRECSQVPDSRLNAVDDTPIVTTHEDPDEVPAASSYYPLMPMAEEGSVTLSWPNHSILLALCLIVRGTRRLMFPVILPYDCRKIQVACA
jgi:hypothetical protein